ncbi:MAG: hypothetical protein H7067_19315 [Burkholderiales bacterium]|nr:hypothetical protein [Opitutaceae bacterium]
MPHDPLAEFDQTLLDVIENSPTGSVPHTPAYQDGLRRLRAVHQVYPAADYKNGYVTVRSLAAKPLFYAQNLEACLAGEVGVEALEADASVFSRYVGSLPPGLQAAAEAWRARVVAGKAQHRAHHGVVAHDAAHTIFLIPGGGRAPGLPGDYLHGSVLQMGASGIEGPWVLQVHDREDDLTRCEVATLAEALAKLQDVLASAPFLLSELAPLGFREE